MSDDHSITVVIGAWVFHMISFCLALTLIIPWQAHWAGTIPVVVIVGFVWLKELTAP